jgi:hypothetical protein
MPLSRELRRGKNLSNRWNQKGGAEVHEGQNLVYDTRQNWKRRLRAVSPYQEQWWEHVKSNKTHKERLCWTYKNNTDLADGVKIIWKNRKGKRRTIFLQKKLSLLHSRSPGDETINTTFLNSSNTSEGRHMEDAVKRGEPCRGGLYWHWSQWEKKQKRRIISASDDNTSSNKRWEWVNGTGHGWEAGLMVWCQFCCSGSHTNLVIYSYRRRTKIKGWKQREPRKNRWPTFEVEVSDNWDWQWV